MKRLRLLFLFSLLFAAVPSFGQQTTYREKKLAVRSDTIVLDTLSLVPGSVILKNNTGALIPDSLYRFDAVNARLIFQKPYPADTIHIAYRTFPLLFPRSYFHKDIRLIEKEALGKEDPFIFRPGSQPQELFSFGSLEKNGSLSRGIRVGNNQDLSVNSAFNLQLAGKISEELEVVAAISDDNIPVQPEGNTQQLQDFDKVYIQVKSKQSALTAGDFELGKPPGYFMNFYKKAKGGYFTNESKLASGNTLKTGVAGAVSKGKYARNVFRGVEGNQGPYRLKGNDNEQFIIILSGTERVYLDGQLMQRGEENDYVIDYNTAELTFTVKRLITLNSRITVEFEYSDKNYARSMLFGSADYSGSRWNARVHVFSEQDSRNQPLLQELNDDQKLFLKSVGDSLSDAFYPNVDSAGFDADEIRYKKIDTLAFKDIYVYSTNPDSAFYRVGFLLVGAGKGNYRQKISLANGRVFEWVAPINGIPQGDHEPLVLLVPPKKTQMVTAAFSYKLSEKTTVSTETAVSNKDVNLYANAGNADNTGGAIRTMLEDKRILNEEKKLSLRSGASYEFTDKKFRPIERYRPVEFEREFNIRNSQRSFYEHLVSARSGIFRDDLPLFNYQLSALRQEGAYHGFRHELLSNVRQGTVALFYNGSLLNASDRLFSSNFFRQKAEVSKAFFTAFALGSGIEQEKDRFYLKNADTLAPVSFAFLQYRFFVQNTENQVNKFLLEYLKRDDYNPLGNRFDEKSAGKTLNANLELLKNPASVLRTGGTWRMLNRKDSAAAERSLLGRVEYDFTVLKSLLNATTYYELGTGQEPRREFTYLEVPAGQGVYYWSAEETDYNKNGIKELNEFEIPKFQYLANHIRVFVPTNEFVRTKSTAFSQAVNLDPARIWSGKAGLLKMLSLFSDQAAFRLERKVMDRQNNAQFLNPFYTDIPDTALVSLASSFRNTFFFNRSNPVFGADLAIQRNGSRFFLTNGFDTRLLEEEELRLRWNPSRVTGLTGSTKKGNKEYRSPFAGKSYLLSFGELNPALNLQLSNAFRLTFFYRYFDQQNTPEFGGEESKSHTMGSEVRYNNLTKGSVSGKVSYIKNTYSGQPGSPVAYEMLEGLQEGNNLTWNIFFQRSLTNGLVLNLTYEGKSSPGVRVIHTGSMQARVVF